MKSFCVYLLIGLFALMLMQTSCSSKLKMDKPTEDFQVSYKISKGRSMTNPAFSIVIDGKNVSYSGRANVDVIGEKTYKLSNEDYSKLTNAFEASQFEKLNDKYIGGMRDLPMATMTYNGHTVKYQKKEAPSSLIGLAELLGGILPVD